MPEPTSAPHDGDRSPFRAAFEAALAVLPANVAVIHIEQAALAALGAALPLHNAELREQLAAANGRAEVTEQLRIAAVRQIERLSKALANEKRFADHDRAELEQLRARLAGLGEEWGIRWTYTTGIVFEGPVADNEDRARQILADHEMRQGRSDIADMTLMRRDAGRWLAAGGYISGALPRPDSDGPASYVMLPRGDSGAQGQDAGASGLSATESPEDGAAASGIRTPVREGRSGAQGADE